MSWTGEAFVDVLPATLLRVPGGDICQETGTGRVLSHWLAPGVVWVHTAGPLCGGLSVCVELGWGLPFAPPVPSSAYGLVLGSSDLVPPEGKGFPRRIFCNLSTGKAWSPAWVIQSWSCREREREQQNRGLEEPGHLQLGPIPTGGFCKTLNSCPFAPWGSPWTEA